VGKIILLNTPIGNLGDLTPRVREAFEEGQYFAAEDTRVFKELLNHLGISLEGKQVYSFHDQSEDYQLGKMLEIAEKGDLYLASDAGSPIISDPAYPLVKAAYERGIKVESYSGISSPIMALELSGLPPIPFQFHGFLPRESGKRVKAFEKCAQGTHIFFDAPTRIEDTLEDLASASPESEVAVVRELSKKFEQVLRFKARDWKDHKEQAVFRGEFILLFHKPLEEPSIAHKEVRALAEEVLVQGSSPKMVAKLLSLILDRPTKDLYNELLAAKK
jgi:16S rRNA (cytidine1402-2'-O)-methyltransferase